MGVKSANIGNSITARIAGTVSCSLGLPHFHSNAVDSAPNDLYELHCLICRLEFAAPSGRHFENLVEPLLIPFDAEEADWTGSAIDLYLPGMRRKTC